jgi:predicted membrane protein
MKFLFLFLGVVFLVPFLTIIILFAIPFICLYYSILLFKPQNQPLASEKKETNFFDYAVKNYKNVRNINTGNTAP